MNYCASFVERRLIPGGGDDGADVGGRAMAMPGCFLELPLFL